MSGIEQGIDGIETASYEAELAVQREIIDQVDAQIVELIGARATAALEIGRIKARHNLPI